MTFKQDFKFFCPLLDSSPSVAGRCRRGGVIALVLLISIFAGPMKMSLSIPSNPLSSHRVIGVGHWVRREEFSLSASNVNYKYFSNRACYLVLKAFNSWGQKEEANKKKSIDKQRHPIFNHNAASTPIISVWTWGSRYRKLQSQQYRSTDNKIKTRAGRDC